MTDELIQCPVCDGKGGVPYRFRMSNGRIATNTTKTCETCHGTGRIHPSEYPEHLRTPVNDQAKGSKEITPYDSPSEMVVKYRDDFAQLLPSHVNADQWVRLAQGAFRRDKNLAQAAMATPASLFAALSNAARLGLEPATEEFYLTPRKNKGVPEVLGIVGYQGIIELIYRAGAVSSVIAEVVYQNDKFSYQPGRDERPIHEIDWDADDRGPLRLAYAYAIMKDGATSKVVVANKATIARAKASSPGSDSKYSPWNTDEAAMWLKTACRQLGKWVPTSAEYRREQLRAVQSVAREQEQPPVFQRIDPVHQEIVHDTGDNIDPLTGEVLDAEPEPEGGWPEVTQPGDHQ